MDVSVVVPFHNEERYIDRCLAALDAQTYPRDRFEIIFVDNASTDRSAQIVARQLGVRLLSEPTAGAYAARNRGVAVAEGKIVAFTDADCSPDPNWLTAICHALSSSSVHLVLGRQRFASESLALAFLADYDAAKASYVFSSQESPIYYGYTNNLAVRRDTLLQTGPFPEWLRGADVLLVHRVLELHGRPSIAYSPEMCVRHWEIDGVAAWLRKMHIYGRSIRHYGKFVDVRPLGITERLTVTRRALAKRSGPPLVSLPLVGLLLLGGCAYELGRRRPWPAAPAETPVSGP